MTIYSHHPHRGKVQILATYHAAGGVVSSTVTSVDSVFTAAPIVDALNRISACATVPMSVHDKRSGYFSWYPSTHLAVLTTRDARSSLLQGTHSLWYEHTMWLLHEALTELDTALVSVPAPIRTAIETELETEVHWLRNSIAERDQGIANPTEENGRIWRLDDPFITFKDYGLIELDREMLDELEENGTERQLHDAIDDLRLLLDIDAQLDVDYVWLQPEDLSISVEPEDQDALFLNIGSPVPNGKDDRDHWSVGIYRWEVDEENEDNSPSLSHGEPLSICLLPERPKIDDVVALLKLATSQERLLRWAATAVGEPWANTAFVVSEQYRDEA